jgi:hypothetical protein
MAILVPSNTQSRAEADGQIRILENLETENAELRVKVVELNLQIQALHDARTPRRSNTRTCRIAASAGNFCRGILHFRG